MRIVGGKYKNSKIVTSVKNINVTKFRPSTERTRESIFNIIKSASYLAENFLENAKVLDLFCGCGAIGLEAFSRGAKMVTFVDIDPSHIKLAKINHEHICKDLLANFILADATKIGNATQEYNLIFLDPPYYSPELVNNTLTALAKGNWLAKDNLIILEHGKKEDLKLSTNIEVLSNRVYGVSALTFCTFKF